MLLLIKKLLVLLIFPFLIFSCTFFQKEKKPKQELANITEEQQSAFDALNTLQVNTDERDRLYSTFADIRQPCYPPDSSFVITQSELLNAMTQFVNKNCTNIEIEERNRLINTSVLAQMEYRVLHCANNPYSINYDNGLPMKGTWIMPNVLGRRDVIIHW